MNKVQPQVNKDGSETVTLFGTTVDVTDKDSFTLFKTEYKVERPEKKKMQDPKTKKEASDERS